MSSSRRWLIAAGLALVLGPWVVLMPAVMIGGSSAAACVAAEDGGVENAVDVAPGTDPGSSSGTAATAWTDPVVGRLSSPYGRRFHPVLHVWKLHDGQDIAAPAGTRVVAAAAGTVTVEATSYAGPHMVTIDHGGGVKTVYEHMRAALVKTGEQVNAGQPIGEVGSEGLATGPHLHVSVWVNGKTVDPMPYFKARGVVLGTTPPHALTVSQILGIGKPGPGKPGPGSDADDEGAGMPAGSDGASTATASSTTGTAIGTLNTLGAGHTAPGRDAAKAGYPGWRKRMPVQAQAILDDGLSIVGLQEASGPQLAALGRLMPGWRLIPARASAHPDNELAIGYDGQKWTRVSLSTITVPWLSGTRQAPAMTLRSTSSPSDQITVINIHPPAAGFAASIAKRRATAAAVAAEIGRLRVAHPSTPVVVTGDFNATLAGTTHRPDGSHVSRDSSLALLTGSGGLHAAEPNKASTSLDYVFGTADVRFSGLNYDRSVHTQKATDHPALVYATATTGGKGAQGATPASSTAGQLPDSWTAVSATGQKITLDRTQLGWAATGASVGAQMGVSDQGIVIAFMTVFPESGWKNYASDKYPATIPLRYPKTLNGKTASIGSDHHSVDIFQQQPTSGWGDPLALMKNISLQFQSFYGGPSGPRNGGSPAGLLDTKGWESMAPGDAAQAVQDSGYPDRYAPWEKPARELLAMVRGKVDTTSVATPCVPAVDSPQAIAAGNPGSGGAFVLGTFNVLGASHTTGKGQHPTWSPGTSRVVSAINLLNTRGVTVAGVQEFERPQARVFRQRFGAQWAAVYPGQDPRNAVIYRRDTWDLVSTSSVSVPSNEHDVPMPAAQLRMKATGATVWILNVHNVSTLRLSQATAAARRKEAMRREKAFINQLGAQGVPVFMTGDFNQPDATCQFVPPMISAFGPVGHSPCRLTGKEHVDKIFGQGATFTGARVDGSPKAQKFSDHALVYTRVTIAGSTSPTMPASTSAAAAVAIKFALAQVGDTYVMGGTGPNVWDCSGLMRAAWRAAGMSLPRTSREQSMVGEKVNRNQMQPGDLIYFFSPVSHVAMYIGGGKMVHAANPHAGVKVSPVSEMARDITVIRRLSTATKG